MSNHSLARAVIVIYLLQYHLFPSHAARRQKQLLTRYPVNIAQTHHLTAVFPYRFYRLTIQNNPHPFGSFPPTCLGPIHPGGSLEYSSFIGERLRCTPLEKRRRLSTHSAKARHHDRQMAPLRSTVPPRAAHPVKGRAAKDLRAGSGFCSIIKVELN